ncbi:hypothetical protein DRO03_12175, partial [Methanosarcinales archaeon]
MNRKSQTTMNLAVLSFAFILTALFLTNIPVSAPVPYEINGSVVYIDDENVIMKAYPHTLTDSGYVTFNLTSKKFAGDIDVVWGFNSTEAMPKSAGLLKPHSVTEQKSYTCDEPYWYNYTLSPKHFYCWQNLSIPIYDNKTNKTISYENSTVLVFDHEFESANTSINTAYWSETHVEDYVDIHNKFNKVSFDYGGMDTWYYTKSVSVTKEKEYSVRAWIDVPFNSGYNKYWFCVKPSSMTIHEAKTNGYLYCLDPWWNSSWNYKKEIQIDGTGLEIPANYQLKLNVDYVSGKMNSTFKDIRFINSDENATLD